MQGIQVTGKPQNVTVPSRPDRRPRFLEERADLRLTLDSTGRREARVTTSRGVAIGGSPAVHSTDPTEEETAAFLGRASLAARAPRFDPLWLAAREEPLKALGERLLAGVSGGSWSATMVAFDQVVWLAGPDGDLTSDVRRGCRYEVVTELGDHPNSKASADWAEPAGACAAPVQAFEWALGRSYRKRRGLRRAAGGETRAVFAPGVAGVVVHELVGHALEGDVVARRPTWIQAHRGADPPRSITVIDDPRRGRGAWTVDDEGTPSQATVLVDSGRPAGLLLDRAAAARWGRPSTGHGRRASYLDAVRPRMGCTYVDAGPDDPAEIVHDTRSGVFIHRMTAGHTDPYEGRASFLVTEADLIERGAIGAPMEPFVIELDAMKAWSSIDRIGHDLAFDACIGSCVRDGQPLAVSVGAPTIRIGVITVIS